MLRLLAAFLLLCLAAPSAAQVLTTPNDLYIAAFPYLQPAVQQDGSATILKNLPNSRLGPQINSEGGTRVVGAELGEGGEELDMTIADELEYGLVTEWVNGLDSLQSAMSDPEVVEEDDA